MLLMYFDKIVARSKQIDGKCYMVAEPNLSVNELPFGLFHDGKVDSFKFSQWVKQRCFPPERMGAAELLNELGLNYYDRWEIVKKTNARLTGLDDFWVDFEH